MNGRRHARPGPRRDILVAATLSRAGRRVSMIKACHSWTREQASPMPHRGRSYGIPVVMKCLKGHIQINQGRRSRSTPTWRRLHPQIAHDSLGERVGGLWDGWSPCPLLSKGKTESMASNAYWFEELGASPMIGSARSAPTWER